MEALSSSGTGQSGAPVTSGSDSARTVLHCSSKSSAFAVDRCVNNRCSAAAPDSPMNYSGARLEKPESGEFEAVWSWCTGPVHQTRAHSVLFAPLN